MGRNEIVKRLQAALAEREKLDESSLEERDGALGEFVLDDDGKATDERTALELVGLLPDEAERWQELDGEIQRLEAGLERADKVRDAAERHGSLSVDDEQRGSGRDGVNVNKGADPHDFERARTSSLEELRGMRKTALESMRGVDADDLESIEGTLRSIGADSGERQERAATQYALAHGSDKYRSAFWKLLTGKGYALDDGERQAMAWSEEARAAITTDTGLSFPLNVDPQMVRIGTREFSPLRRLATVRSGTAPTHAVNTLGNATFSMALDGVEVTDGTPADDTVSITAQIAHGVVLYSIAAAEDMMSLEADLRASGARALGNLEATQFTTGNGTAPNVEGILDGTTIARVTTGTATKLTEEDLIAALNALPDIWHNGASWMMSQPTQNALRLLEDTGGSRLWQSIGGSPTEGARPTGLLGLPTATNSVMADPTTGADTFTTGDDVAVVGNIAEAFRIYDRIGMSVEPIPLMMGTTANLPNGTRGVYMRARFGAGIVNSDAARVIRIG